MWLAVKIILALGAPAGAAVLATNIQINSNFVASLGTLLMGIGAISTFLLGLCVILVVTRALASRAASVVMGCGLL